jgi:putative ABC transport system permease protein
MPDWKRHVRERLPPLRLAPERELEIIEELAQYLEDRYEELRAGGATERQAFVTAARELNVGWGLARELRRVERQTARGDYAHGAGRNGMAKGLWQDLRYGVRTMRKSPGYMAAAVLTLALGIGANTAIFSVVNAVLLRPLPYEHPERLVRVLMFDTKHGETSRDHAYLNFADLRAQNNSFEGLAAYADGGASLTGDAAPERISGITASANLFSVLGVNAQLGRTFTPEDERPGASAVVISHGLWQRKFGSDSRAVGRQITLGGKPETVVGVLPAGFRFPFINTQPEYFVTFDPQGSMEKQRGANYVEVIGRLKEGVPVGRAEAEMSAIAGRLEQQYPEENDGESVSLVPAHEDLVGDMRPTLLLLLGAVGFVLLIACANVANLQLARASGRGREVAIRTALGASRRRIVRQLLTESLLLSTAGGALGLLLAAWGISIISAFVPADIPRVREAGLDPVVLTFTLVASVLTGVAFGLAPALQVSRVDLNETLKEGGRGATEGRGRNRVRGLLIVSEVALSLVLLVGAGLLIKSFVNLRNTNAGFDPRHVLTASVSLPKNRYSKEEQQARFYRRAVERAAALPGVEAAGAILPLPYSDNGIETNFSVEGQPELSPGAQPVAGGRIITPDYLRVMGIPLVKGRTFDEHDTADAPQVLLVNETLARRYFPDRDPIGQRLHVGLNGIRGEIVGVVGDMRDRHLEKEADPEYYVPYQQVPVGSMALVLRARSDDPADLAAPLRAVVQDLDKDLPLYEVRTMESRVADSVARQRFSMTLLVAFAGLALLVAFAGLALAGVGIFSVMSFLVAQRTHEIGVRVALGAQPRDILRMAARRGMALALLGVAAGLAAAFALTRLMAGLLYGVTPTDPITFVGVSLLLALVALLACLVPARRATKVDPLVALRYE